jgi:hypothetical protein
MSQSCHDESAKLPSRSHPNICMRAKRRRQDFSLVALIPVEGRLDRALGPWLLKERQG